MLKLLKKSFLLLFINAFFISNAQKIDSVIIGNGGGFSGRVFAFKILKENIEKGSGLAEIKFSETCKIPSKCSHKLFKNAQNLLAKKLEINAPANTYQFVEIYADGKVFKFMWSEINSNSKDVKEFYDMHLKYFNELKFIKK